MKRGGQRIVVLAMALAAGALAPVVAEPVPAPTGPTAPADTAPSQDPIADIINRQAMPVVLSTRLGEQPDKTRFVVELSDPVQVRVFTLTNPDRVVIDMPEVLWRVVENARPSGKGAVQSYRYGLFRKGNSRFVIDLGAPVRVDAPRLYPPEGIYGFRMVIDLYPTTAAAFAANAGWPQAYRMSPPGAAIASLPPPQAPVVEPPVPATPRPPALRGAKRIIVVDPGHGGIDPGTHGATGLQEKDIVLAVAKRLREALEASGHYKVRLTRDTDVFIPLRERVNIARAAHGDLFISLHIDFNDHHEIRGASIYTLSEEASDREAAHLAEKENMSDVIAGVDLSSEESPVASILIDLAQRDTMNRSARFAQTALAALPTATLVRPNSPHKSAGFAVLKGPDIPAVLIELGYLSNSADEREMATDAWRKRVARAIAAAIDTHFARETPAAGRQAAMP